MKNKKLISLILACVIVSISTVTAYAESISTATEPPQITAESNTVVEPDEFVEEIEVEDNIGTANATRAASYEFLGQDTIPNGIYALHNYGNSNRWMDVQYDSTSPGFHMQQYAYGTTPADTQTTAALYKVTQVGNTGRYIIRLMLNQNLTFGISGSEVLTKTIPANDSNVSINDTFYITRTGSGYIIQPYNSEYCISAKNTTASGMDGAPDSYLEPVKISVYRNQAKWMFEGQTTYIDNGVYALENVANTNRWMDTEQDFSDPGHHIQQYDYGDIPTVNFNRGALFKIAQVGATGQYVIRSMLNNRLSFGISNGEFITKEIPTNDNTVSSSDRFIIQFWNGGYILRPVGQNYIVASNHSTASGMDGAPNSYLIPRTRSNAGYMGRWELYKYTGQHRTNVLFVRSGAFIVGQTVSIEIRIGTTRINYNDVNTYVNASVISSYWNPNTKKIYITCHRDGAITIFVEVINPSNVIGSTISIDYSITLPLEEGEYFIQNKELKNYIQIDDNADYSDEGAKLEVHELDGGDYQRWEIEHISDGYYKIISIESDLVIAVRSGNENSDEKYLIQEEYTSSDRQKWRFVKYTDGSYEIKPLSGEDYSTDWCMAAGDGLFANGRNVEQREYTSDSNARDRWIMIVKADLSLLALPENYDRTSFFDSVISDMASIGYSKSYDNRNTLSYGVTTSEILGRMLNSKIIVIRTHGAKKSITTADGSLATSDLSALSNCRLGYAKLVIYGACLTGEGGSSANNLVNATHEAGATTAIGFEEIVYSSEMNQWCEVFFEALSDGATVEEACDEAKNHILINWVKYDINGNIINQPGTDNCYIAGNKSLTFP